MAPSARGRRQAVELLDLRESRCRPAARRSRGALRSARAGGAASAGRTRGRRTARAGRSPRLPGSPRSRRRRSATPGLACFRSLTRPRSAKTFSCAFSRTEQVLNRITSASSGVRRSARSPAAACEHVGHLVRVVLVHLAAEGADENLLGLRHAVLETEVESGQQPGTNEILPRLRLDDGPPCCSGKQGARAPLSCGRARACLRGAVAPIRIAV